MTRSTTLRSVPPPPPSDAADSVRLPPLDPPPASRAYDRWTSESDDAALWEYTTTMKSQSVPPPPPSEAYSRRRQVPPAEGEAAVYTPVSAIMSAPIASVRPDMPVDWLV